MTPCFFAHDSLWSVKGYLLMCLLSFVCWFVQAIGFKVVTYLLQLVFLVCAIAQICSWLGLIDLPLINYVR